MAQHADPEPMRRLQEHHPDLAVDFARRFLAPTHRLELNYVPKDFLRRLGITRSRLDFMTGQVERGVSMLLKPMPVSVVEDILRDTKPWNSFDMPTDLEKRDPGPIKQEAAFDAASRLSYLVHIYLEHNEDESSSNTLIQRTKWRLYG